MSVADLEIDITRYAGRKDFQVYSLYRTPRSYSVVVRRLDATIGWTEAIRVLAYSTANEHSQIIDVGPSESNERIIDVATEFDLQPTAHVLPLPNYEPFANPQIQRISRQAFNRLFDSDVVVLPASLFAVGVKSGVVYLYNETYEHLYMIELSIRHLVGVILSERLYEKIHFVISAYDGFLEGHWPQAKTGETPYTTISGEHQVLLTDPSNFPVLYSGRTVLAQSHQLTTPNAICIPDRYYFYMNRYNEYRSIHGGIPFSQKKSQIVYGSQPRGTKYNFTKRRDIEMTQREYFNSDAVPKSNIVAPKWIERSDMVHYKYILDIDGNTSTWDATAWKLNSGSVILKTDSCWNQWFYDDYKPWVHYVPVADDFSDIQDRFQWCEAHPAECQQMIKRCRALFQHVYRFHNVVEYTKRALYKVNHLVPAYIDPSTNRRLFLFSFDEGSTPCTINRIQACKAGNIRLLATTHRICQLLRPDDLVMYANLALLDFNSGDSLETLLRNYDAAAKAIVFGAEKNLWPEKLEIIRYKLEDIATDSQFKYLNSGFFVARVDEMKRLLDERIYEPAPDFIDQVYFSNALLTGRYSMTLDYSSSLVLNTFRCSWDEVDAARRKGTPFIHWNGGRW